MTAETIFVQIASYRDPELKPTIDDLLAKAEDPSRISIGICWQHDEVDNSISEYKSDKRFRIIDVNWKYCGGGVCWARAETQKLYMGETYTLQLDSHHRFAEKWDSKLISLLKDLQSKNIPKPLITSYAGIYDPSKGILDSRPFKMVATSFGDKILLFHPVPIPLSGAIPPTTLSGIIPARYLSGHFYFTLGQHCLECPYDPNIYFHGEEITMSVRSYTHGYDLFHPTETIIWHNYARTNRVKHWDDHTTGSKPKWYELDAKSKLIVVDLLAGKLPGYQYGFGTQRTVKSYETYAGVDFKNQIIGAEARNGIDPVNRRITKSAN